MPSFCQLGQKAYLYADGGPFAFDGPIDVSVEVGEVLYSGNKYRIWVYWPAQYEAIYCTSSGPFSAGPQYTIRNQNGGKIKFRTVDSQVNFCPNFGHTYQYWCDKVTELWSDDERFFFGTRVANAWHNCGDRVQGIGYHEARFVGAIEPPRETTGYILKVSKSNQQLFSKSYPTAPAYTVKCGDRCPPGEKWDPISRSCCCENMASLTAQMKGAVNIARGIKP